MRSVWIVGLGLGLACGDAPRRTLDVTDVPASRVATCTERVDEIRFLDQPIGYADETLCHGAAAWTLTRTEALHYRRGDAQVRQRTAITVITDDAMRARSLTVERDDGASARHRTARLEADGWRLDDVLAPAIPRDGVPVTLVPYLLRERHAFTGPVFDPASAFAVQHLAIVAASAGSFAATATTGTTVSLTTLQLGADGLPTLIRDDQGVSAHRIAAWPVPAEPPALIDLLAAAAIPVDGSLVTPLRALRLQPVSAPPPPELPGQAIVADATGWTATLQRPPLQATSGLFALADDVRAELTPSLAATTPTSGDCTTFALRFAERAIASRISTRIVTGYVLDGHALLRHRWNVARVGARWITVDASAPASTAPLLGLYTGTGDAADLARSIGPYSAFVGTRGSVAK